MAVVETEKINSGAVFVVARPPPSLSTATLRRQAKRKEFVGESGERVTKSSTPPRDVRMMREGVTLRGERFVMEGMTELIFCAFSDEELTA